MAENIVDLTSGGNEPDDDVELEINESLPLDIDDVDFTTFPQSWLSWLWCRTSPEALRDAESAILSNLKTSYHMRYVNIGPMVDHHEDIKVWTISSNETLTSMPLVLIHGLGSGCALWALNLDKFSLSGGRPVYAIDIPGFGRSSRPHYSTDPHIAEQQLTDVIEAWRVQMNLDSMVLLGHSFGGFISFAYTLRYPDRVAHLICEDPWGFNKKPEKLEDVRIPGHNRTVVHIMSWLPLNPLWLLRFVGPLGPKIIQKMRADLVQNFVEFVDDAEDKISNYVFHCNAQPPTGESAFYAMMTMFGWAKNPMYERLEEMATDIPLTLIYGARSWVDHYPAEEVVKRRPGCYVDFHIIDASHHVHADQHELFNELVLRACQVTANGRKSDKTKKEESNEQEKMSSTYTPIISTLEEEEDEDEVELEE